MLKILNGKYHKTTIFTSKSAHFSNRSFVDPLKSKSFVCIKCGNSIDIKLSHIDTLLCRNIA